MAKIDKESLKGVAGKGKGFIEEFKSFILRGNVMDMAIGVIIGAAFADIVNALTADFINPLINGLGGAEVGGKIAIYGGQFIDYGHFITAVINFVIMAFILFMLLKVVNKIMTIGKKKEEEAESITKSDELVVLEQILAEVKKK